MTMNMTMTIRATVRQIVLLASLVPTTSELNSLLLTSPILIPAFQFILLTTLVSFPRYLTTVSDVGHHQRSPRNFFGPTYIFFFYSINCCLFLGNLTLVAVCLRHDAGKHDLFISGGNDVYLFF